jgi:hypothetical protein
MSFWILLLSEKCMLINSGMPGYIHKASKNQKAALLTPINFRKILERANFILTLIRWFPTETFAPLPFLPLLTNLCSKSVYFF